MLVAGGAAQAQTAQVTDAANVNMRSGRAENYRIIRVLPPHIELDVVEVDQDYAKVKTADGETGWVLRKFLDSRQGESEKEKLLQGTLEAAQKELITARMELANLQRIGEQTHHQPEGSPPITFLLLLSFGAFACGVAIGVMALRAYYHKRLHGLRI